MERKWKAKRAKSMALGEHKENTKRLNFVDEFNKISPKNFATSKTAQVLLREYVRSHAYKMRPKGKQRHNVSALHKYLQPLIRDEWDKKQKEEKNKGKKVDDRYERTMMTHCYNSFIDLYKEVYKQDHHIPASEPRGAAESLDEDNNSDESVSEYLDDDKNKEADDDKELSESFVNKCVVEDDKEKIEQLEEKIKIKLLKEKIKKLEEENTKMQVCLKAMREKNTKMRECLQAMRKQAKRVLLETNPDA